MQKILKVSSLLAALALIGGTASLTNAQAPAPAHQGVLGRLFGHHPKPMPGARPMPGTHPMTGRMNPMMGGVIGNKKTRVYHLPGDRGALPAPQNRVYFHTAAQARAAGYHAVGQHSMGMTGGVHSFPTQRSHHRVLGGSMTR